MVPCARFLVFSPRHVKSAVGGTGRVGQSGPVGALTDATLPSAASLAALTHGKDARGCQRFVFVATYALRWRVRSRRVRRAEFVKQAQWAQLDATVHFRTLRPLQSLVRKIRSPSGSDACGRWSVLQERRGHAGRDCQAGPEGPARRNSARRTTRPFPKPCAGMRLVLGARCLASGTRE